MPVRIAIVSFFERRRQGRTERVYRKQPGWVSRLFLIDLVEYEAVDRFHQRYLPIVPPRIRGADTGGEGAFFKDINAKE